MIRAFNQQAVFQRRMQSAIDDQNVSTSVVGFWESSDVQRASVILVCESVSREVRSSLCS